MGEETEGEGGGQEQHRARRGWRCKMGMWPNFLHHIKHVARMKRQKRC